MTDGPANSVPAPPSGPDRRALSSLRWTRFRSAPAVPRHLPVQLVWTLAIAGHLMFSFLTRRDEKPLIAELDASYGAPPVIKP